MPLIGQSCSAGSHRLALKSACTDFLLTTGRMRSATPDPWIVAGSAAKINAEEFWRGSALLLRGSPPARAVSA